MRQDVHKRSASFAILTVCVGNICRSPIAEQLLRAALSAQCMFEVTSAGLATRDGLPMHPESARLSQEFGGDPGEAVSSALTEAHVRHAQVILTMTAGQRDEVMRRYPWAMRRTFSLAEFARLLDLDARKGQQSLKSFDGMLETVARLHPLRSRAHLNKEDDIPDPINADLKVHRRVASQILGYVTSIAAHIA